MSDAVNEPCEDAFKARRLLEAFRPFMRLFSMSLA